MKDPAPTAEEKPAEKPSLPARLLGALRRRRYAAMLVLPVIAFVALAGFMAASGRTEATDNAYVQAARVAIATSVPGRVVERRVNENERVEAGQVLLVLDKPGFESEVRAAEAALAVARAQVASLIAAHRARQASLHSAEEALAFAESEAVRKRRLAGDGVTSRQDLDAAEYAVTSAQADVDAAKEAVAQALAELGGASEIAVDDHPLVREALARLETAKLDLSYADVLAPQAGIVTRVDQVQVGSYVNAGQTLFWLVAGEPWVEANFKEDQLKAMRVGQTAHVRVDAYPQYDLEARVASFSPGTGAVFAPLPAQNATGNWVKVTQRLPVRLTFVGLPEGLDLQAGLSAHARVETHAGAPEEAQAPRS
jgi:membrane fusion protein (multidrug efflux system)